MDRGSSGRGLVHAAAWTLATGAAVALSWFGVHTVLSGTVYDAPRALPLSDQVASSALPQVSSTHRPKPSASPSASPSSSPADDRPPRTAAPSRSLDAPSSTSSALPDSGTPAPTGDRIRGYVTNGGRVVLSLGADSAELVSATPNAGWQMQVWKQNQWLRVDFTGGGAHTSVICTWNGHPPLVETSNHAT